MVSCHAFAGKKLRVLFLGNSYIYVNNLPQIIADIATSMGDTLLWEMEAPGGFTLNAHYQNSPPSINKIKQGGWDYVVLQEQSQTPAYPDNQVNNGFFPFARKLDSLIDLHNPCAQTIFYMTWGRKNGDAANCTPYTVNFNWPHFCTYASMDSVLRLRYMMAADSNKSALSPAGAVWRYIRYHYPSIDLYDPDESHPSPAGSYAAAFSFYTALFKKDPATATYNYSLNSTVAANIRTAVKKVVYDSMLHWHIGQHELFADFVHSAGTGNSINFTNKSLNSNNYSWYFGDGQTSTLQNPVHTYTNAGKYTVMLVAANTTTSCNDTVYSKINVLPASVSTAINETSFIISPNPVDKLLTVSSSFFLNDRYRIEIRNNIGQVVYDQETTRLHNQTINMSAYSSGIYLISIISGNRTIFQQKALKQ